MTQADWEHIAAQNRELSALAEAGRLADLLAAVRVMDWQLPKMTDFDYYAQYCRKTWGPTAAELEAVVALIRPGPVLDVGFGYGHLVRRLVAIGHEGEICGIDSCATAVELLQAELEDVPGISLQVADALSLPFADGSVDTVVMMELLEHLSPARGHLALLSAARVATQQLILSTRINENLGRNLLACPHCGEVIHPAGHVRSFSETLLRAELKIAGWWPAEILQSPGGVLTRCRKLS